MGTRLKKCCRCYAELPIEQFTKDRKTKDGLCCSCKECAKKYYTKHQAKMRQAKAAYYDQNRDKVNAQKREYRKNNQEKLAAQWKKRAEQVRNNKLKRLYGISYEDKVEMHKQQNGVCPICYQPLGVNDLHVDHDHDTGEVRGLLCKHCNMGLGNFKENTEALERALSYIQLGGV